MWVSIYQNGCLVMNQLTLDLDLGLRGLSLTMCAPRRASHCVMEEVPQLQLMFLYRECKACKKLNPLEGFVRNGRFYRRVCKTCWAAQARAKELEKKGLDGLDYCKRLNRLWPAMRTA